MSYIFHFSISCCLSSFLPFFLFLPLGFDCEIVFCDGCHDAVYLILLSDLFVLEAKSPINANLAGEIACENDWRCLAELDDSSWSVVLFTVFWSIEVSELRLKAVTEQVPNLDTTIICDTTKDR